MQGYFPSSTFIIIFCSIFLQLKLAYIVLRGMCFSCKWHSVYLTCLKFVFVKEMMFCCIKMYLSCLTGKNRMAKKRYISYYQSRFSRITRQAYIVQKYNIRILLWVINAVRRLTANLISMQLQRKNTYTCIYNPRSSRTWSYWQIRRNQGGVGRNEMYLGIERLFQY